VEIALFHRQRKNSSVKPIKSLKDLTRMVTAAQFLAEEKRQSLLQKMKDFSGLEPSRYESLCVTLIENLVNYCQNLPETTNSYFSHSGGLCDYALNRTEAALSLFNEFMVHERPDSLSEEQKLWQYALFSAALLQGIGKLYIDYRVSLFDASGHSLKPWNPLLESLTQTGTYYDYEFQKESDSAFRCRLNLLIAKELMPMSGFVWIASDPQVLAVWLALLNEDHRSAGTLGAILIRADALAIQRYLNELLIRGHASRGGRLGRASTFAGGAAETLIDKEQAIGVEFLHWLTKSLDEGRIMINKAPLLMVPGGMLMSQEMFQLFVRENPEYKNWQAVQTAFLSLGLHGTGLDGSAVSRFEQDKQMQTGVVFSQYAVGLPASFKVQQTSSGKSESMTAAEFINKTQFNGSTLQKLAASGQWQTPEVEQSSLSPGAKTGV